MVDGAIWCYRLVIGALLWLGVAAAYGTSDPPPSAVALTEAVRNVALAGHARYLVQQSPAATPDAVEGSLEQLPWRTLTAGQGNRLDDAAMWIVFDAQDQSGRVWYLQLGASGIDRAQLFYRGPDGKWIVQEAGDTLAVSDWPVPGRLPTFELARRTDQPVRYWLRIEHERVDFAAPIALFEERALMQSREREQFVLGGYFGLAVLIVLVSLGNAIVWRDRNFGVYAVYVFSLAMGQVAYLGVGSEFLWNNWLSWNAEAPFMLPTLSAATALWFARTVTEPGRYSRMLDLGVWAVIAALLSAVAVDAVVGTRTSLTLMVGLSGLALVVGALLVAVVWLQGEDPYVRLIALGFLPVLVAAIFPIARGLNFIPVSLATRYGVSVGAALEMPILFYALSVRGTKRREAAVRAAALSRTDALTGLAHTRTLLQRLEATLGRSAAQKQACALIAARIANYDKIVEDYGREIAERVLVVAASLIRGVTSDVDMAARVGDHEFAVLLEAPAIPGDATMRAQRLVAGGLRSSEALPPGLALKFHVVAAMLPERGMDATGTLRWILDGVDAMRPDARKLIRQLNF